MPITLINKLGRPERLQEAISLVDSNIEVARYIYYKLSCFQPTIFFCSFKCI